MRANYKTTNLFTYISVEYNISVENLVGPSPITSGYPWLSGPDGLSSKEEM